MQFYAILNVAFFQHFNERFVLIIHDLKIIYTLIPPFLYYLISFLCLCEAETEITGFAVVLFLIVGHSWIGFHSLWREKDLTSQGPRTG